MKRVCKQAEQKKNDERKADGQYFVSGPRTTATLTSVRVTSGTMVKEEENRLKKKQRDGGGGGGTKPKNGGRGDYWGDGGGGAHP